MLKKTVVVGGAVAGMLALSPVASADTQDNDGINVLNDNNVSAVPIQLCGNNIAVLTGNVTSEAPQSTQCVNAPIVDHPTAES